MIPARSKYAPLEGYLKTAKQQHIRMSFAEIETIINAKLPPSARKHRPWWSNNPTNSVITYAWLNAGYKSAQVDMEGETLTFIKNEGGHLPPAPAGNGTSGGDGRHPVFGCMKGTVTIAEGVDLTQPALPEWADMCENPKLYND